MKRNCSRERIVRWMEMTVNLELAVAMGIAAGDQVSEGYRRLPPVYLEL